MWKKLILIAVLVVLFVVPAMAEETDRGIYTTPSSGITDWLNSNDDFLHRHPYIDTDTHADVKPSTDWVLGAKADLPNLIRLTRNLTIGVEGGKDLKDC